MNIKMILSLLLMVFLSAVGCSNPLGQESVLENGFAPGLGDSEVSSIEITAGQTAAMIGTHVPVHVRVLKANQTTATDFAGTVTITSTDSSAVITPSTYSFVTGDLGEKDITVEFRAPGSFTVTANVQGSTIGQTSAPITVTPGSATDFSILAQPSSSVTSGASLGSIQVQLLDSSSNPVTDSGVIVSAALSTNPGSATLAGTTSVATVSGVATFTNLNLDKVGTGYRLEFTAGGVNPITSNNFNVTVGSANKLAITAQPASSSTAGNSLGSVQVQLRDIGGNPLTTSGTTITASISNNPSGGTLSGTTSVNTVNGVATFTGLLIDKVGTGYSVQFSSSGLTSATSDGFAITAAAPASLSIITGPAATSQAGASLGSIKVQLLDSFGNSATSNGITISAALDTNTTGGSLGGTTNVNTVAGVATFSNLTVDKVSALYTLEFSSSGLTGATSSGFAITPAAASASTSTLTASPTSQNADGIATITLTATIKDAYGNPVPNATVTLSATGTGNTLTQPSSVTNASGQTTGSIKSTVAATKVVSLTAPITGVSANAVFNSLTPFTQTWNLNSTNSAGYTLSASTIAFNGSGLTHVPLTTDKDNSTLGFGGGVMNEVTWNGSAIGLTTAGNTAGTGTYTSRIFSAPANTNWTELSWDSVGAAGKALPNNRGVETAYASNNADMSDNVLLMHMDESTWSGAGSILDSSGTGNHGTPISNPAPSTDGYYGGAGEFTSNGKYVSVPHSPTLNGAQKMSFELWMYPTTVDNNPRGILSKRKDAADTGEYAFSIFQYTSSNLFVDINGTFVNTHRVNSNYVIQPNKWQYVVVTFDGSLSSDQVKIYVNNSFSVSRTVTATSINATTSVAPLLIGAMGNSYGTTFLGKIDEVAIYKRVLSPTEVQGRYRRGLWRTKFQVRACDNSDCSDQSFKGPGGSTTTYYTENLNTGLTNKTTATLNGLTNKRYFQYKVNLDTGSTFSGPSVEAVVVQPALYDSGYPRVTANSGASFKTLSGFSATTSGSGEVRYQVSVGGTWYWHNGTVWTAASTSLSETNTASEINAAISQIPSSIGQGTLSFRAFFNSGSSALLPASLSQVVVTGQN